MTRLALPVSALALGCIALSPASAAASGSAACGDIDLATISECHVEWSGGCEANCDALSFQAACDGQCNAALSATCVDECWSSCVTTCEVQPGSFSCEAECHGDCSARAVAECGCDDECIAIVEASCQVNCEAECSVVPPSASCETQCNACCGASCEVEANVDCNVDCTVEMQGGCEVDCEHGEGALFCDGQYIPYEDLEECLDHLSVSYSVDVDGTADASLGLSCSTRTGQHGNTGAALWLLAVGGLVAARRRRR